MARYINECPALKLLQETDALVDLHVVEQFLEEVVAVVVFDQLCEMAIDLFNNPVNDLLLGLPKVVLKELRANFFNCQVLNIACEYL